MCNAHRTQRDNRPRKRRSNVVGLGRAPVSLYRARKPFAGRGAGANTGHGRRAGGAAGQPGHGGHLDEYFQSGEDDWQPAFVRLEDAALRQPLADLLQNLRGLSLLLPLIGHFYFTGRRDQGLQGSGDYAMI